jgi:alpha-glucosidase (family GH31 glycosyl hydrolase)
MAKVWPGMTVFPDFFNPEIYKLWDVGLEDYYKIIKYDGIWLDMNEPSNLNNNTKIPGEIFENEEDGLKYEKDAIKQILKLSYLPGYRNNNANCLTTGTISMNAITYNNNTLYNNKPLISVYQVRQTYNYLKKTNKRPFILTRANSFGSGKYSFHWLGDNFSKNKYIKYSIAGIFNYNIFGIPFTGADICGFNEEANGKLCARWYNIGAFYPFSRNHNSKKYDDKYPWTFGKKIEKIIKKDIAYRYSLLRYFYSQLFLVSLNERGSFFKPVMFEYPNDIYSYEDIESKVMIGDAFLICAFFYNKEDDKEILIGKQE